MLGIFCLLVGLSYIVTMVYSGFTNSLAMWTCIQFLLASVNLYIYKISNY